MVSSSPIVRAIDVGYAMTKFTTSTEPIRCQSFPSLALPASDRDLGIGRHGKRNTLIVPVGAQRFEVGPDARLAQAMVEVRPMADDFVMTDEYLALTRGALRYMREDHVDLLMVGLPVSLFNLKRRALENRLTGHHDVGEDTHVQVERVIALAQPIGAFLSYAVPLQQRRQMLRERNLIIDPGGRTFDWLVTEGLKPLERRSDSINRGMVDVLDAIARSIGTALGIQLSDHDRDRIDQALRRGESPRFFGTPCEIAPHRAAGVRIAKDALTALQKQVHEGSDIDNIVLTGGGAFFFRKEIERAFPKHRISQVDDPLYANVRGFLIAGQELAQVQGRRGARAVSSEAQR